MAFEVSTVALCAFSANCQRVCSSEKKSLAEKLLVLYYMHLFVQDFR